MLFFNQSSSLFHKCPLSPFYLQWSRTALGAMRWEQCYLQHVHSLSLTWSLAWLKQLAHTHFPQVLFSQSQTPAMLFYPLPQLRAPSQADSNHYVSERFDWVSKLNQLKKWFSKLQSWHKASSRELEGGAALPPPLAACCICSRCDCSHLLSPQLHFQLLVPDPSFALAQALVPCHNAGETMQGAKPAEGYWALLTTCQKTIFSQPSSRISSDQKSNQYKQ